jgi:site-specific recombinase XerD
MRRTIGEISDTHGLLRPHAGHDTRALQAWLGHRNIQHTVRYTELAPDRFKNFWRD